MCRINLPCGILLKYPFRDLHASPLVICNMFSHLSSDGTGQTGWCLPAAFQFHYNLMCQSEFSGETFRDVLTNPKTQKSVQQKLKQLLIRICELVWGECVLQVRLRTHTQLKTRTKIRLFVVFVVLFIKLRSLQHENKKHDDKHKNLHDVSEQSFFFLAFTESIAVSLRVVLILVYW